MSKEIGCGGARIPVAYIVADTGIPENDVLSALEDLRVAGIIEYHDETETVLDRVSLKFNPLSNGVDGETGEIKFNNRLPGALRQLESFIDSPLLQQFAEFASRFSPDFALAIYEKFPYLKTPGKPL